MVETWVWRGGGQSLRLERLLLVRLLLHPLLLVRKTTSWVGKTRRKRRRRRARRKWVEGVRKLREMMEMCLETLCRPHHPTVSVCMPAGGIRHILTTTWRGEEGGFLTTILMRRL